MLLREALPLLEQLQCCREHGISQASRLACALPSLLGPVSLRPFRKCWLQMQHGELAKHIGWVLRSKGRQTVQLSTVHMKEFVPATLPRMPHVFMALP